MMVAVWKEPIKVAWGGGGGGGGVISLTPCFLYPLLLFHKLAYTKYRMLDRSSTVDPELFGTRVGCHVSAVEWV